MPLHPLHEPLSPEFFQDDLLTCARHLLGCHLLLGETRGRIVETEAYAQYHDAASHMAMFQSAREYLAHATPGMAYVYFHMGVHHLLNVAVKGGPRDGLILIRALEPLEGLPLMRQRRAQPHAPTEELYRGPGRLTRAMGIDATFHRLSLCGTSPLRLLKGTPIHDAQIAHSPRIGITRSAELPWRFFHHAHPCVSKEKGAKIGNK